MIWLGIDVNVGNVHWRKEHSKSYVTWLTLVMIRPLFLVLGNAMSVIGLEHVLPLARLIATFHLCPNLAHTICEGCRRFKATTCRLETQANAGRGTMWCWQFCWPWTCSCSWCSTAKTKLQDPWTHCQKNRLGIMTRFCCEWRKCSQHWGSTSPPSSC